jgi:NADH-quinone oxidoreductase subunit M
VAEVQILIGTWKVFPIFAVLVALGILVGVAYTLRAVARSFFAAKDVHTSAFASFPAISAPERIGAIILLACTVAVGLYPKMLLDFIQPSLESPLMSALWKGAGAMRTTERTNFFKCEMTFSLLPSTGRGQG